MNKRMLQRIILAVLLGAGMYVITAPAPTARAARPSSHIITRTSGETASVSYTYASGNVSGFLDVTASPQGFQVGPTQQMIPGPAVLVTVSEVNNVTNEGIFVMGFAPAPGLQIDATKLTSATLPAVTVPVGPTDEMGNPTGPSLFDVSVGTLTWTGVGPITRQSGSFRIRVPGVSSEVVHFKGTFREATVSGTVSYPSPLAGPITLTSSNVQFAQLMTNSSMDITIQR